MANKRSKPKFITGHTQGLWQVIEEAWTMPEKSGASHRWRRRYVCKCRCGTVRVLMERRLVDGSMSCGCAVGAANGLRQTTHGGSGGRLYRIWRKMKTRCHNISDNLFERYGAIGITVCDEWRNSFDAFQKWALSHGYLETLTVDRIDGSLGYYPDNCRWATHSEQLRNTKRNRWITAFGETKCITDWAKDTRCTTGDPTTLHYRLKRHPPEAAITLQRA